ncbi:MAG: tRNA uridine-5-carboxymethylaminomethyl(34) synthesis GTPase MnmE [Pseudomonadota bacterium]|nr:tRNA uridine-5-carboxymethylaminomethyl(34) synthesis GTPase MnmE [Pseudomonadota bacterium]
MPSDTIFALATPPGKSGVAIIRLSGQQSLPALRRLSGLAPPAPRMAQYVTLCAQAGGIIDRGLAIYFKSPHSFTGEDVVELHIHGGRAVIKELLDVLGAEDGLRPAEPGEFSHRAFVNGKMDLMEAEGLADLVDAETSAQKTQAMRQMQGEMSARHEDIRQRIVQALAYLEAYIDFPDEEIPESVLAQLAGNIKTLQSVITGALADHKRGERLREGISIVILGAPNVGKSSLLNAMAKREAAIVSAQAGTTRDIIEVHMDIAGYPVVLADTAGLRAAGDAIEEEGVRRALARAGEADIKLVLFDGSQPNVSDAPGLALMDESALAVVNKSDIMILHDNILTFKQKPIYVSAKTGQGIELLLKAIEENILAFFSGGSTPFITRSRHRALLTDAADHLGRSLADIPPELKCEELRLAAQAIGKITGKIAVDDVLDVVFSQFCIGK